MKRHVALGLTASILFACGGSDELAPTPGPDAATWDATTEPAPDDAGPAGDAARDAGRDAQSAVDATTQDASDAGSPDGSVANDASADASPDVICVPDCSQRLCGNDPVCGTSCGQCASGQACLPTGTCPGAPTTAGYLTTSAGSSSAYVTGGAVSPSVAHPGEALFGASLNGSASFGALNVGPALKPEGVVGRIDDRGAFTWAEAKVKSNPSLMADNRVLGVVEDASGNVFFSGTYKRSITIDTKSVDNDSSNTEIFLAKLERQQQGLMCAWGFGMGWGRPGGLALDAAGNVVVGGESLVRSGPSGTTFTDTGFVHKRAPNGTLLYWFAFTTSAQWNSFAAVSDLAVDASSNTYFVGSFTNDATLSSSNGASATYQNAGGSDVLLGKLDPQGNVLWTKHEASAADESLVATALTASKNGLIVLGRLGGPLTFGGVALSPAASSDLFLAELDGSGNVVWARTLGTNGNVFPTKLAVASDGTILFAGRFTGTERFGTATLPSLGGSDGFIAAADATGAIKWVTRVGGANEEVVSSIAVHDAGMTRYVTAIGTFQGTAHFGPALSRTAAGLSDLFVWRFSL